VNKFIQDLNPWGHADFNPKLAGKSIHVMISPLPRNKRAKHPREAEAGAVAPEPETAAEVSLPPPHQAPVAAAITDGFANNPFADINLPQ
jgi:hypothetical protein